MSFILAKVEDNILAKVEDNTLAKVEEIAYETNL